MKAVKARVSDLAEQVRGVSYGKTEATKAPKPGYVPILRAGNITDEGLHFEDLVFVPKDRVAEKQRLRRGDIVIAASSGSLDVVGKAASVTSDFEGSFGAFCKVLRPNGKVDPVYFAHFFRTQDYRRRVSALAAGANINNLRNEHLDDLELPLPPLGEQRRIAALLDKANELRTKRRTSYDKLNLLERSLFLGMFGDPARNTRNYPTALLGELGQWSSGGTPPRSKMAYFKGEIPWFSSGELNDMFIKESKEHISLEALSETSAKPVRQGSLLLGMYDTAALKAAIADIDCSCNQAIAFAELDEKRVETAYVYFAIVVGREHFRRLQRGVRQKNLNLSMVKEIRIPIPPIEDQRRFCRAIDAIGKLREKQRIALQEQDKLFHCLEDRLLS